MKIINIHIKNFRSIRDSGDITDVTTIFALIGRNNAGKSSFLKAIQILFNKREIDADDFHKDTLENLEIKGAVKEGFGEGAVTTEFKVVCEKEGLKMTYYINGEKQTKTSYAKEVPELLSISDIRNPGDSTTGGSKTTLLKQILKLQEIENNEEFATRFNNLSREIADLKRQESEVISQRITEKFKNVVDEQSFSISITPDVDLDKGITYKTGITDHDIPEAKTVDILSSGTGLQSMYLLSLLEVFAEMSTEENKAILVVEEPEVYLHPTYQRRMFAALRRIADKNQVIFTTHSPIMIADIWLTESVRQVRLNENGETQIESVKIEDVINELGIRYEDVLNPKLVVFVEGGDDVKFFKKIGLDNPRLTIIPTDSFRAIHYYAFIKIISSEHVSNEFVLVADSDGEDPEQRKEKLKGEIRKQFRTPPDNLDEKLNGKIYILNKYSIESYLLDETILHGAFPEIDLDNIRTFLSEYQAKYEEKRQELGNGRLSIGAFQQYLKPKRIFETFFDERAEEAYRNFWSGHDTFLIVKGLIAQRCRDIGLAGNDPFEYMLNHANLENVPELVEKKNSILSLL